jgi:hypothetical protein
LQCTSPATGNRAGVSCAVSALIPIVKAPAYADTVMVNGQPQYRFKTGTLNGLLDEVVQGWYYYETNLYLAAQAEQSLSSNFFSVFLEVPTRFVTSLGSQFPASIVLSALAARTGLPETSISNVLTYRASRSGYSILQFSVTPTGPTVTSASVTAAVLSTTPTVFSVTIPGSLPVFLFIANRGETARAASLSMLFLFIDSCGLMACAGVIRFLVENDGLHEAVPTMSSAEYEALKTNVLTSLSASGVLTSQILFTNIFVCAALSVVL